MAKVKEVSESKNKFQALEEKYGVNTIVKASNPGFERVKESTSTGSLTLDIATGINGVPKDGKITHILGKESASKTTLSLHIIAEEQKKGNLCAFLDVEGTLSLDYAESIGVNLDKLYLVNVETFLKRKTKKEDIQAISGEEWLEILCDLIDTKEFGIIVLDSVAELCPQSELSAGIMGAGIAAIGRLMSKSLRTINAKLMPTNTGLVLLNQYRTNIGGYGNPFIEVSGEALKYYTALKIEITKSLDKDSDGVYGIEVKAKVTKSKVSIPYKEANYYVEFGKGIQKVYEILDLAVEMDIVKKAGGHHTHGETKLGASRDASIQFLIDNPEYGETITQAVLDKINGVVEPEVIEPVTV